MRSRFLDEIDPGVVRTESGATIQQRSRTDGEEDSAERTSGSGYRVEYDWKKPLRTPKPDSQSTYTYEYDDDQFTTGAIVMHPAFVPGKIIQRSVSGRDTSVVVVFKDRAQKTLMLQASTLFINDNGA